MKTLATRKIIMHWAEVFANDLGIPMPKIAVYKDRFRTCIKYKEYKVFINLSQIKKQNACPIVCLAHEMKHAWQFHNRILIPIYDGDGERLWKGKFHDGQWNTYKQYQALPWERNAISYEKKIAKRYNLKMRKLA